MSADGQWPQVGDVAVELHSSGTSWGRDRAGANVTVEKVTTTLVITSDGERYNRRELHPVSEGRYSDRHLVPATDPRVLTVRARGRLNAIARQATNLDQFDHKSAEDVVSALAQIIATADAARQATIAMLREASEAERGSSR